MAASSAHVSDSRSGGAPAPDLFATAASRERYAAFASLQAAAVAFGESIPFPEIVAVGGQSDGKSSLMEALLGFRFNLREVEMGTRRPLSLQMVHNPAALEPICRLQAEDSDELGPPIHPPSAVAEAIRGRTTTHLASLGAGVAVSAKPIVLRAEYAYCANLTIIDTPGLILKARAGESPETPEAILSMVKALIAPRHRLIVFLQQASVEWCSTLWLHVATEADPGLTRTVLVASKFDNRLKEFAERWEVDKYLSASGYLPAGARPFFVALPKDRAATVASAEFRRAIAATDAETLRSLRDGVAGGFDEATHGDRVGFAALRSHLESELTSRYRAAVPGTLALLEDRCDAAGAAHAAAIAALGSAADASALRSASLAHALSACAAIGALVGGATSPDPAVAGQTTAEERLACGRLTWPGVGGAGATPGAVTGAVTGAGAPSIADGGVTPPHAGLRLYGGAAFERALTEAAMAAAAAAFPAPSAAAVANALLAHGLSNHGLSNHGLGNHGLGNHGLRNAGLESAVAAAIGRSAAASALTPILDAAVARLAHTLSRLMDVAAPGLAASATGLTLAPYPAASAVLRRAYAGFVAGLATRARAAAAAAIEGATSPWARHDGDDDDGDGADAGDNDAGERADAGLENAGPATARRAAAPLRESQTVPETPSPPPAAAAAPLVRNRGVLSELHSPNGRPAKHPRPKTAVGSSSHGDDWNSGAAAHAAVAAAAASTFGRIRAQVARRSAPQALRAAFLGPLRDELAPALAGALCGGSDAELCTRLGAAGAREALAAAADVAARRHEGLLRCRSEFEAVARAV